MNFLTLKWLNLFNKLSWNYLICGNDIVLTIGNEPILLIIKDDNIDMIEDYHNEIQHTEYRGKYIILGNSISRPFALYGYSHEINEEDLIVNQYEEDTIVGDFEWKEDTVNICWCISCGYSLYDNKHTCMICDTICDKKLLECSEGIIKNGIYEYNNSIYSDAENMAILDLINEIKGFDTYHDYLQYTFEMN